MTNVYVVIFCPQWNEVSAPSAIFSTREKAEAWVLDQEKTSLDGNIGQWDIEEYLIDQPV